MTSRTPQQTFLTFVALAPALSATAAEVIYDRFPALRVNLAESPHVAAALRTRLLDDVRADVRAAALEHTSDPGRLDRAAASRSVRERAAAARNRATPVATLERLAASGEPAVVRHLLPNPTLPTSAALDLASRFVVGQLWGSGRPAGSGQGSAVWRSPGVAETLEAHPEVATRWRDDPEPTTARVIAYSPTITASNARWLIAHRRTSPVQRALAANPFVHDEICDEITAPVARADRESLSDSLRGYRGSLAERTRTALGSEDGRLMLASAESRTTDWLLSYHPDLELEPAVALAARRGGQTVEPNVMARLVNRFGARAAVATADAQSTSRLRVAGQWSPLVRVLSTARNDRIFGRASDPVAAARMAEQLTEELGDDRPAWEAVVGILRSSGPEFTPEDLATLALGVTATAPSTEAAGAVPDPA